MPEYITECRKLYPEARFHLRNVFSEGIDGFYDVIVLSQVLNNRYQKSDNLQVMQRMLELAFAHSRVAVSIDMLSDYADAQRPELFYYSPGEMLKMAKGISRRVVLRHDYRPYEFCIQIFHDEVPGFIA